MGRRESQWYLWYVCDKKHIMYVLLNKYKKLPTKIEHSQGWSYFLLGSD